LAPKGYSNGVVAEGRQVFIAGQIGSSERGELVSEDFVAQAERALANIVEVLAEAGGEPRHLTRLTWFAIDKAVYVVRQKEIGEASPGARPSFSGNDPDRGRGPARAGRKGRDRGDGRYSG
jgi:enamine deaminase RidA (YjgF/YER057c/UK114 family)